MRSLPRVLLVVGALLAVRDGLAAPRVILVSWDGAGFAWTQRMLDEGHLPNLRRLVEEGAWTDGMVSSFPTKTAAAHAVLFTGHYGHRSGITGNSVWKLPAADFDRLTTANGYFSDSLRVDPVWYLAARRGIRSVAVHATQAYPFAHLESRLSRAERERVAVVHGYTEHQLRGAVMTERTQELAPPADWSIAEARGEEARAFRFEVDDDPFWGLVFDDPLDPVQGCDTLGVARSPDAPDFEARVKAGSDAGFSTPVSAARGGAESWFSLRAFALSPGCDAFSLYRSGANHVALSRPDLPHAGEPVLSVYAGNGGSRPYRAGALGERLGDGAAEARFLETLSHLGTQLERQARALLAHDYGLAVLYSPVSDDVAHELGGFIDPTLPGHDPVLAERAWDAIVAGFEIQDRYLGVLMEIAAQGEGHVLLVSDHGMASTNRLVHVNVALARAGLLAVDENGRIDLARTRVLMPPLADGSVAVNSVDRAGGIVAVAERPEVLREARRALASVVDPDTGAPVVTGFHEPATSGLLQPGGVNAGDLFLDFAPGYYPSSRVGGDVVIEPSPPAGNHIFRPTRRDMLAIFAAWGPRIRTANWGRVQAIDVVPTVLDLLEIPASDELPGRSLVPARPLLGVP